MTASASHRPARRAGLVFAWTLAAILVLGVLAAAWIGVRGVLAYGHLQDAQQTADRIAGGLDDPAAAAVAITSLSEDTAAARGLTSDPVWRLAEGMPWIGPQLAGVATVTAAVDDVARSALGPLAEVAASFSLDTLRPRDGVIDVSVFEQLRPAAEAGAEGIARAGADVDAIDTSRLLVPLRAPIEQARALLNDARTGADALARATALMPAMLGADGPRNYLVIFQNNAEWRSSGGIIGAMALVHTEGGRMSLADQGSSTDFRRYEEPVVPLSDELVGIYGHRPALWVQNATQVADFALTGSIAREMWARETGVQVDGVISLDPVALSYLLATTGPVTLPTGDVLSSDNAVSLLLNEVYRRYERPSDQDAFFEATAAMVFDSLSSGDADPTLMLEALSRAGDERRLLLWNANPDEQAVLDGTTLQGPLPVTDSETTSFGVYLNDGTGSKMDFYMAAGAAADWCTDTEGDPDAGLVVTLRNTAPADAATLPRYITGGGTYGIPPGTARTLAYVYLPRGAELISATPSGSGNAEGFGGGVDADRQVISWTTDLAPGQEASLFIRVRTPSTALLDITRTPTVNSLETAAACIFL